MDKNKRYIFPKTLAEAMSKVDQRVQYEASMMSMVFILTGLIVMAVYMIFFTEFTTFMKVMVGINTVAGFIFLWSYLVTTYQQYLSYLEAADVMLDVGKSLEDIKNE
jgi:hypothetical protein